MRKGVKNKLIDWWVAQEIHFVISTQCWCDDWCVQSYSFSYDFSASQWNMILSGKSSVITNVNRSSSLLLLYVQYFHINENTVGISDWLIAGRRRAAYRQTRPTGKTRGRLVSGRIGFFDDKKTWYLTTRWSKHSAHYFPNTHTRTRWLNKKVSCQQGSIELAIRQKVTEKNCTLQFLHCLTWLWPWRAILHHTFVPPPGCQHSRHCKRRSQVWYDYSHTILIRIVVMPYLWLSVNQSTNKYV